MLQRCLIGIIVGLLSPILLGAPGAAASEVHQLAQAAEDDPFARRLAACLEAQPDQVDIRDDRNRTPLMIAAGHGHSAGVAALLAAKADLDAVDDQGRTAVHHAVSTATIGPLRRLIAAGADLDRADAEGSTALHRVLDGGSLDHLPLLLDAGADPDLATADGLSPLMVACRREGLAAAALLIAAGADLQARDAQSLTVLARTQAAGDLDLADWLQSQGADEPLPTDRLLPVLLAAGRLDRARASIAEPLADSTRQVLERLMGRALSRGRSEVVAFCLEAGVSANHRDGSYNALGHVARTTSDPALVDLLLAHGADPDLGGGFQKPLLLAVKRRLDLRRFNAEDRHDAALEVIRRLVAGGASLTYREPNAAARDALDHALHGGDLALARLLVDLGAPIAQYPARRVADAASSDDPELLRWLLERGLPLDAPHFRGKDAVAAVQAGDPGITPLIAATEHGATRCATILIDGGARLDFADAHGMTPLHHAAAGDRVAILRALLAAGADADHADRQGRLPLHHAASAGSRGAAEALLAATGDLAAVDARGASAVDLAIQHGHEDIAELLLANGVPSRQSSDLIAAIEAAFAGEEADALGELCRRHPEVLTENWGERGGILHLAVAAGADAAVAELVEMGAVVDLVDNDGLTALRRAVDAGRSAAVRALLLGGADPDAVPAGETGRRPARALLACLERRREAESDACLALLLEHGAEPGRIRPDAEPLVRAVELADVEAVRLLLEHGADPDPDRETRFRRNPLQRVPMTDPEAARRIVMLLVDHGLDIAVHGQPLVVRAVQSARPRENLAWVLDLGVAIDSRDLHDGGTAVHDTLTDLPALRLLIEHGADVTVADDHGRTPLTVAETFALLESCRLLEEAGAPATGTPRAAVELTAAWRDERYEEATRILEEHPDLLRRWPDEVYDFVPHLVQKGHMPSLRQVVPLLGDRLDRREPGRAHNLLMMAAYHGHADAVELLLAAGADPRRRFPDSQTAIEIARERGYQAVVDVLVAHGAVDREQRSGEALIGAEDF